MLKMAAPNLSSYCCSSEYIESTEIFNDGARCKQCDEECDVVDRDKSLPNLRDKAIDTVVYSMEQMTEEELNRVVQFIGLIIDEDEEQS